MGTTVYTGCTDCCGDPTSDCCTAGSLPDTIFVTFTENGSACTCADMLSITLTRSGSTWSGSDTICGETWTVTWTCDGDGTFSYTADLGCVGMFGGGSITTTCDPLNYTVNRSAGALTGCVDCTDGVVLDLDLNFTE